MRQPYSYQKEVPEGVRWDRKGSPEFNLHVCGEDGIKRVVYNMKKGYAGRGSEDRVKKKDSRRKHKKEKELYLFQRKETNGYINSNP